MTRRQEFNLTFEKNDIKDWGTTYSCLGNGKDKRSHFIAYILGCHNQTYMTEVFLEEIEFAEQGKFDHMDDFWQPDGVSDSFRCHIFHPFIILGGDYDYSILLKYWKELLQEWLAFLKDEDYS